MVGNVNDLHRRGSQGVASTWHIQLPGELAGEFSIHLKHAESNGEIADKEETGRENFHPYY